MPRILARQVHESDSESADSKIQIDHHRNLKIEKGLPKVKNLRLQTGQESMLYFQDSAKIFSRKSFLSENDDLSKTLPRFKISECFILTIETRPRNTRI